MNKRISLLILLLIILIIIILFSIGSTVLTKNIFEIPIGNIIVWIGFISIQLFVFTVNNRFKKSSSFIGKLIRYAMIVLVVVSILWFGIAYVLSGNVKFNFSSNAKGYLGSPKASILYWYIIYTLVIAPIILMISYSLLRYFERIKGSK